MITLAHILIETRSRKRQAEAIKHYETALELARIENLLDQYIEQERKKRATVPVLGSIGDSEK